MASAIGISIFIAVLITALGSNDSTTTKKPETDSGKAMLQIIKSYEEITAKYEKFETTCPSQDKLNSLTKEINATNADLNGLTAEINASNPSFEELEELSELRPRLEQVTETLIKTSKEIIERCVFITDP